MQIPPCENIDNLILQNLGSIIISNIKYYYFIWSKLHNSATINNGENSKINEPMWDS